jgi:hypothetical protein
VLLKHMIGRRCGDLSAVGHTSERCPETICDAVSGGRVVRLAFGF